MSDRRSARQIPPSLRLGAALVVLLTVAGSCWMALRGRSNIVPPDVQRESRPQPGAIAKSVQQTVPAANSSGATLVLPTDAPRLLWESPTSGRPLGIAVGLPGAQLILRVRMSQTWQDPEFQRIWKLLGERTESTTREVEQAWRLRLADIDQLTLMAAPRDEQHVDWIAHVALRANVSRPAAWHPTNHAGDPDLATTSSEFEIPAANAGKSRQLASRIVSPPGSRRLKLIIATEDQLRSDPPDGEEALLLRPDLGKLHAISDRARQLTLITTTSFLMSHPEWFDMLVDPSAVRSVLRDTTAISLSAHWNQHELYVEFISAAPLEQQQRMVERYRELVSAWSAAQPTIQRSWPDEIRAGPFGQRWPVMADFFAGNLRIENHLDVTLVNASLPVHASQNLVCGLLLSARFPLGQQADGSDRATRFAWPSLLATRITYRFEQRPLDDAVAGLEVLLREAAPGAEDVRLVIDGAALETVGITRNQQIRNFQVNDLRLADVLRQLANMAQPGKPDAESSLLVWAYLARDPEKKAVLTLTTAESVTRSANLTVVEPVR